MYISRVRRTKSEGSVCNIRMLISYDDRTLLSNQDLEYILLSNFSHSLGNPTPNGFNQTPHCESRKVLCGRRNFLGTTMRQKSSAGQSNQNSFLNQSHRHSVHKMEEFSGRIPLKTHHTGLLLSLPPNYGNSQPPKSSKTVHFLVGKQEDYEIPPVPVRRSKRSRLFHRHSVSGTASKINLNEATPKATEEEDIVMEFPLRRSVSLDQLSERQGKCMDIVFQHTESHFLDSGKKTLGKRMKRVTRGLNLTDMHWISRKHSVSSGISLKSTGSYYATQASEVSLVSLSLRIQTDEITPIRSLAPANLSNSSDSKSNHIGRFVVLKATVSNTNEDTPTSAGPDLLALDDTGLDNGTMTTSGPPETHYWTVSGGKEVLLTAPGARRVYDSRPTSGGPNRSMHTRFRQFFVENLRSSRQRTHSEQQANCKGGRTPQPPSESPNKLKPPTVKFGGAGLPPHAHTITAGTGSAVARALLQSTQRAKDDGSIESSGNSGLSSSPMHYPSISLSSVNDSEGGGSYKSSKKRLKSTHTMVKKLLKISSNQKKQGEDYGDLPDPSKLPREMPQSSLEFTQSRLKNAPRRSHPSGNYGQKGSMGDVIPRVLPQVEAKSEELLLSAFSRSLPNSNHGSVSHSHHHKHHHHHHNDHHGHHSREMNPSTLTRVTENRRYLMFTKASPFRSPYDFMQTRGKGLHESEVYTVLFRHTTCYELMPESAKLVTLDSILPVGKAFRALCENGIRAAPVWDSETQTFSGVLTINDFLEMLTYCWRKLIGNNSSASSGNPNSFAIEASEKISIEELESMPIKKWKEIRSRLTNRRSSGMDQHGTIHEEDENVSESSSGDSESGCDSSSSSSRSSSSSNSIGEDRDADSDSVASAPSQIGESNTPRPPKHPHPHIHHHHYHHHFKTTSVRGCDFLKAQGGKCSVRLKYHRTGGLTVIYPEDSLYSALRLLAHCQLHRLPVFDDPMSGSGNPLFILTHRSLLAYLYKKQIDLPRPKYLQASLKEAGVGTYKNLSLVLPTTKLVDALAFFENETVSVLPVVDSFSNRRLLDIFAKFDVITLILAGKHKKPDMTVQDVLDTCKQIHRGVIPIPEGQNKFDVEICQTTDTIQFALNKLMRTGYHRLILVDNHVNCRVEGVVSISDLLYYMVLRPSPRGPVASGHGVDKPPMEAKSADGEGTNPDWLFYSEQDPNAMGRSPCVPLVKDLPEPSTPNNKEAKKTTSRPAKQECNRLRMTSESSVTTGSTVSSRSSSSSSTTSSSSTYSSSSGSSSSTSSTTSTTSRSRSSSPKRTQTVVNSQNSKGPPKRASIVDNRKGGNGKPRAKTVSS